jgi:hypothetical protein
MSFGRKCDLLKMSTDLQTTLAAEVRLADGKFLQETINREEFRIFRSWA